MSPSRIELAALNNTHWYQAMFDAHGLASIVEGHVLEIAQRAGLVPIGPFRAWQRPAPAVGSPS